MTRLRVLISHSTEEKALAEAWRDLITTVSSSAVEVWFSSDTVPGGGMAIGQEWRTYLYDRLAESDFVLAIQTPVTAGRPWIMWECGVASGVNKVRRIIPITFSMGRGDLGNPLTSYQVYEGENAEQVREVCARLAEEAGLTPPAVLYETAIDAYLKAIKLHSPRAGISTEQMALWKDRFEELIRSGRVGEIPARRQAMYAFLGQPFEPVDPALHELLSRTLLDNGHYAEAIEEVDYALRLAGQDVELLHRKALALVEMQNLPGAEELIRELLAQKPELKYNPELTSLEGRIHRERWQVSGDRGELDRAFEAYLRAYRADRTQYYPGINAGSLALARGEDTQAEEIFEEVLDTCNSLREHVVVSYWVDFSAGEAHLGLSDVEGALSDYRQALLRTPAPPSRDRLSAMKGVRRMVKVKGLDDSVAEQVERVLS